LGQTNNFHTGAKFAENGGEVEGLCNGEKAG
jgi:hypothetical protein